MFGVRCGHVLRGFSERVHAVRSRQVPSGGGLDELRQLLRGDFIELDGQWACERLRGVCRRPVRVGGRNEPVHSLRRGHVPSCLHLHCVCCLPRWDLPHRNHFCFIVGMRGVRRGHLLHRDGCAGGEHLRGL